MTKDLLLAIALSGGSGGSSPAHGQVDWNETNPNSAAYIKHKPRINGATLTSTTTSFDLGLMDAPDEPGAPNAILKNTMSGWPSWANAALIAETEGSRSTPGTTVIMAGNALDPHSGEGKIGMFRMLYASGNNVANVTICAAAPTSGAFAKTFLFGAQTPAGDAYVISSSRAENAPGALAKFEDGLSVVAGNLVEEDIEVRTNKVTSVSAQSTDTQYPSAKCVYDAIDNATTSISDAEIDVICQ